MATNFDRAVGWGMVFLAAAIFVYYTFWVIVLPFIPRREKIVHSFFLPRFYATAIPLGLMVAALIVIGITVAVIMMKEQLKSKPKKE